MGSKPWGNPSYPYLTLINNGVIPAGDTGLTEVLDVMTYSRLTIYVKTDKNKNVYVKGGIEDTNICHLVSGTSVQDEDTARVWNINNTLKCFSITEHIAYLQILIDNVDTTEATVSVWLSGD